MKTVTISKKKVIRTALGIAALVGLVVIGVDIAGNLRARAAAQDEVASAAAHGVSEALWFDHQEGQEAWEERVRPLCTDTGWSFWNLVGLQVWPSALAQKYGVQEIEVLEAAAGEPGEAGQVTVNVRLRVEYVQDGQASVEEKVYPVVMVEQDGRWLMDVDRESMGGE